MKEYLDGILGVAAVVIFIYILMTLMNAIAGK